MKTKYIFLTFFLVILITVALIFNKKNVQVKMLRLNPYVAFELSSYNQKSKKWERKILWVLSKEEINFINKKFPRDRGNYVQKVSEFSDVKLDVIYTRKPFINNKRPKNEVFACYTVTPDGHIEYLYNLKMGTVKHYCPKFVKAVYEICDKHGIKHPTFKPKKDTKSELFYH